MKALGGNPVVGPRARAGWWSVPATRLFADLASGPQGLTTTEAARRRRAGGANVLRAAPVVDPLRLLLRQVGNPLVLILVVAAAISAAVHEVADAAVILAIVAGSAALTFVRELRAATAVERLRRHLVLRADVLRDGQPGTVAAAEVVPGDVVLLAAGSLVPADGVLLEATDLFVNQAALTGETFPAEKRPGPSPADAPLAERTGALFQGTSVRSGLGRMLVTATGQATAFGAIATDLLRRPPETEFERGLRRFGYLLTRIMVVLVLVVFAANVLDRKPAVDSLLFALALAVGMSPELLPAIVAVNLSRGARDMAAAGVIVRRLDAIENLGSMDVLCVDKTGTLTTGVLGLEAALDGRGDASARTLRAACLNALLESGLANPLDEALRSAARAQGITTEGVAKRGEVPYDFLRKRLSVAVVEEGRHTLLTKGAFDGVLACCSRLATAAGETPLEDAARRELRARYDAWGDAGLRVLGVAAREISAEASLGRELEQAMTFVGFLLFSDPPKPGIARTVEELRTLGVELKILTGDNRRVAAHLARQIGLPSEPLVTGAEVDRLRPEALAPVAAAAALFAELEPQHKERLLRALQGRGRVVGFLGDGINDAPALHLADVGVSVDSAVDVAKEAADFVLLRPDLGVLTRGIADGRRTFANTMKYVSTTSSANFGNMVSMAVASAALPFLPLLATQILLNNFLTDLPAIALSGDDVDRELVARPRRWNLRLVRDFMMVFGLVSSLFDLLLFAVLLWVVHASAPTFRSAWFVESALTEVAVMLVLRTRRPFYRSRPGRWLGASSAVVALTVVALPYAPRLGPLLGFVPLPLPLQAILLLVTALYVLASEAAKRRFYRRRAAAA